MDIGKIPYQQMINKESKTVSAKTVSNAYDLVRHALDYAKFPRPVVKLPTIVKAERKWLDYEQIQSFTLALRDKHYELGALLALHGLRHSWVSLCFHLHWDPQTVMREGGYSNMQTINEIYRHLAAQDANEDIKSMQEFFTT